MRLLAYIMRKDSQTIRHIERELNTPYSTVRDWLKRVTEEGIRGRYDKKIPGPPPKLMISRSDSCKGICLVRKSFRLTFGRLAKDTRGCTDQQS